MSEINSGAIVERGYNPIKNGPLSYVELGRVLGFDKTDQMATTLDSRAISREKASGEPQIMDQAGLFTIMRNFWGREYAVVYLVRSDEEGNRVPGETTTWMRLDGEKLKKLEQILEEREKEEKK